MVEKAYWDTGTKIKINSSDDMTREGFITDLPMMDEAIAPLLKVI